MNLHLRPKIFPKKTQAVRQQDFNGGMGIGHLLPGAIGDPFRALAAGDLLDRSHEFIANNSHLGRI